ncbi:bile acid:sodium symporter [Saccharopolyspora sp. NFXS83]|uniref:bile acid:sodium symporter family protein n=1 Tax=Saccharopolyspora sp. NFXS83 TaxID=2993560 RepID=UPI00224A7251|nr:bile acid:sodium symporter family protein [Saccharopolyspora sp. NFXS83]MCX2733867.1 bile acid:sodium symporter [Saccharopolyspora sp. NFXS83]
MKRPRTDPYIIAIVLTAVLAAFFPIRGEPAVVLDAAVTVAVGFLFFLYGARLPHGAAWEGIRHWRLHGAILLSTYALFPVLGLATAVLVPAVLSEPLHLGLLFLCVLPSTVQSSITFTSLAGGNVAAAICAATFSNVLGVLLTPVLAGLLLAGGTGAVPLDALPEIVLLLLVPFLLGQFARRWIGERVREQRVLGKLDRGVILAVVFSAFSEGTAHGIWKQLTPSRLLLLAAVCLVLLVVVLAVTSLAARWCGFTAPDRIALVFAGSKKSLASGLPMASVLLPAASVGLLVLPLMLYHQLQLIACAWLARRFAERPAEDPASAPAVPGASA